LSAVFDRRRQLAEFQSFFQWFSHLWLISLLKI
jgi:hypothetical protein